MHGEAGPLLSLASTPSDKWALPVTLPASSLLKFSISGKTGKNGGT